MSSYAAQLIDLNYKHAHEKLEEAAYSLDLNTPDGLKEWNHIILETQLASIINDKHLKLEYQLTKGAIAAVR